MKSCKTFYEAKKTSRFNGIIQPPPPSPPTHASSDKILLRLFLQSTSRMQFWASRNGGVQVFFLTWNIFAGNFLVNSERFLAVLQGHVIFNVNWAEVQKMSEVSWPKSYCQMSNLFR